MCNKNQNMFWGHFKNQRERERARVRKRERRLETARALEGPIRPFYGPALNVLIRPLKALKGLIRSF